MATMATNPNTGATSGFSTTPPPPSFVPAQAPSYIPSAAAKPSKRSPVIPIVIGVVLLLLVIGVGGGIFIWSRMSSSDSGETKTDTDKKTDPGKTDNGAPAATEAMRYWLELEAGSNPARVAAVVPLASGQKFKFHFNPTESGYLYIIGPGEGNVPTTFLSSKPIVESGVTTNNLGAGANYSFPNGDGNWITLDKKSGEEIYTVIFSKTPITSLPFLDEEAWKALSEDEQGELNNFLSSYKANAPTINVIGENSNEPYVSLKPSQAKDSGDTLVFDVRIVHK